MGAYYFHQETSFQPQTKEELQTAVDLWVDDNAAALSTYGEINSWDVSLITDMSNLFIDDTWSGFYDDFNDDIGNWDVSNVTNMAYMFASASDFNQDISSWDVSNVITMQSIDRKSTRLNSSHALISYAVFCLKKKKKKHN